MDLSCYFHALTALSPRTEPRYSFNRRLSEYQSRSQTFRQRQSQLALTGNRTPVLSARSVVTILLRYLRSFNIYTFFVTFSPTAFSLRPLTHTQISPQQCVFQHFHRNFILLSDILSFKPLKMRIIRELLYFNFHTFT
jgi:hypothetical protein